MRWATHGLRECDDLISKVRMWFPAINSPASALPNCPVETSNVESHSRLFNGRVDRKAKMSKEAAGHRATEGDGEVNSTARRELHFSRKLGVPEKGGAGIYDRLAGVKVLQGVFGAREFTYVAATGWVLAMRRLKGAVPHTPRRYE